VTRYENAFQEGSSRSTADLPAEQSAGSATETSGTGSATDAPSRVAETKSQTGPPPLPPHPLRS